MSQTYRAPCPPLASPACSGPPARANRRCCAASPDSRLRAKASCGWVRRAGRTAPAAYWYPPICAASAWYFKIAGCSAISMFAAISNTAIGAPPRLLLLDEPRAALDQRRKEEMLPYLIRLRALLALPIFYVSHDLDELVECADHLLLLEDGKVGAAGPLAAVLARVDLRLTQGDDAGAVIATVLAEHDNAYHLSHLRLGAQRISVGRQSASIGTQIRF